MIGLMFLVALTCHVWSIFIVLVQAIGAIRIFRSHANPPSAPTSSLLPQDDVPHITIIRPVKDPEPGLYECLASTFRQTYPREKLTVYFCVESINDGAHAILQQLVRDFPEFDARVMVAEEDPLLHGSQARADNLGPNPKICNVSRAHREAKGDVIWAIDCNVWVSKGVAGRMVDKLFGFLPNGARTRPYKFVHQLPLVVDIGGLQNDDDESQRLFDSIGASRDRQGDFASPFVASGRGSCLEEMFMATTHAKFYSAINTVGVAPCIVGKSNMFRRSHLLQLTDPAQNPVLDPVRDARRGRGIDFFSSNICEDHLIGDLMWRSKISGYANHGLVFGDLAIQPVAGMSVSSYIARRVRWLRVRKWTVKLATLIEPGVESLLCSLYLAFAVTTLPWYHNALGIPQTWTAMFVAWIMYLTVWMFVDCAVYRKLHKCQSVEVDQATPAFARGTAHSGGRAPRPFGEWIVAWLGREVLALPIWTWAVLLGTEVTWRGKRLRVQSDMTVVEIEIKGRDVITMPSTRNLGAVSMARSQSKDRVD